MLPGPQRQGAGMFSTLSFIVSVFSSAFVSGRSLAFTGEWNFADLEWCEQQTFSCYFEAFSNNCSDPEAARALRPRKISMEYGDDFTAAYVPAKFRSRGIFWWQSMVAYHLLKLNQRTAQEWDVAGVKADLQYEHPVLGIHIRRGDACYNNGRQCFPLARYFEEALLFQQRYGVSNVFIATDSEDVIAEVRQSSDWKKHFVVKSLHWDRRFMDSKVVIEKRMASKQNEGHTPYVLAKSAWLDLELLSDSDFLIGHLASNMFRVVLQVSAAKKERIVPYVSVDGPWCNHWRMCCNVDENGDSSVCVDPHMPGYHSHTNLTTRDIWAQNRRMHEILMEKEGIT